MLHQPKPYQTVDLATLLAALLINVVMGLVPYIPVGAYSI
jgi:hypothetical protein